LEHYDIPADVVHIDPWWMRWRHYCDFTWDESAFPHPKEFIERLHARGLKLCLWEHPYISIESELFAFGKKNNYFVLRPDGEVYVIDYGLSLAPRPDGVVRTVSPENSWNARVAIVDLTNPQARTWFKDLHRAPLRMGVDLFKTDFGEDIPEDAVFSNGQTGASMHNLYPLLYNEAVFEVTREEKGAGLVWSRSGTAGNQRYPVCWSGDPASDFDSLACTIRGGLSAGLSGIPFWSNDIGGYRGIPDEDLYIRWAQFGLLCSHSRMHGDSPREPSRFGPRALEIVRKYIELRYRLFPYIYSTAHEASRTGIPVLRALPLAFPDDPNSCAHDLEFLLGPWLLIAPVYNREGERDVYFPPGVWIDYWDGSRVNGPCSSRVSAPIERLPIYVRAGAILPTMEPVSRIPAGPLEPLILDVYPYGESTYHLHEDEGTTEIRCVNGEEETSLEWSGSRSMSFAARFNGITASEVLFDGSTLRGWAGDASRQEKMVSLSLPRGSRGTVRIRH
jgi:alpha-D-xyloside xylohydrolase